MAFPQVAAVNGGFNNSYVEEHILNLPTGVPANNLILMFFFVRYDPTITWPEGWTQLALYSSLNASLEIRYRIADGNEGATITVTLSRSAPSAHTSYGFTGFVNTLEAGEIVGGDTTTPDPPSLTPSWGAEDTLWIAAAAIWRTIITYPSDYTNGRLDSSGDMTMSFGSARRELNAATEDPGPFTLTANGWLTAAVTVAIQPGVPPAYIPRHGFVNFQIPGIV